MAKKHSPGFIKIVEAAKAHVRELSIQEVKQKLERGETFRLFDVREDHEWQNGHLPTAEHLSKGIIERDIEVKAPDLNEEIILYCGGGFRSALAADNLGKMGYKNVHSMDGGFHGWVDAGFPIEKEV